MNRILTDSNRFSTQRPELVKEWCVEENLPLTPDVVAMHSHKKVLWRCSKESCNHEWIISVSHRTRGDGCPACSGRCVSDRNRLSLTYPGILKEWNYQKNKDVFPHNVSFGSDKRVWWTCEVCGYVWESNVYNRTRLGRGCPRCANRVIDETNSLRALYPHLVEEWDYTKNNKYTPDRISYGSEQKVWWKCFVCSYSWEAAPNSRTYNKSGCPKCAKNHMSGISQEWLDGLGVGIREYYIKELKLTVDGFDPETNTVYEFHGDFWHGNPEVFDSEEINWVNKKTFGQLYEETKTREKLIVGSGFKLVVIWEKDFSKKEV